MSGLGKSILLGIDLGTSSCKVAFFDYSGNLIAQISEDYPTFYSGLWAEQNPEDWWQAIKEGIKRLIVKYRINPGRITGIGIDGQSWAALPIGKECIEPRDKYHSLYQELFEVYQNLYLKFKEDFEHLVKIAQMAKSL